MVIKRVERGSKEVEIAQMLSTRESLNEEDNHTVPILDYFDDKEDKVVGFLVMPFLRPFDDPEFSFVSEVVDFVHQTLHVSHSVF